MTFILKKFQDVFEDLKSRTTILTDFEVGSVTRTMYESFAYEIALLYEKMHLVYLSAYVDTAEGQQLDNVVAVLGIQRGLPDFAEGMVTFDRDIGNEDIQIPIGTLVATEDTKDVPKKTFQTIEPKILPKDNTSVAIKVQAINRGATEVTAAETIVVMPRPVPGIKSVVNKEEIRFVGKRQETDEELRQRAKNALISSGRATIMSIENALLILPKVKDVKVKENFAADNFGIIEVFVSGIDFTNKLEVQRIQDEIDRVRAAGIFVLLKSAARVEVSGQFSVELNPELTLSDKEKDDIKEEIKKEITRVILGLKMGKPLLFSHLIKNVMSLDGVHNLEDFTITIKKEDGIEQPFTPSDKRIDLQESEKFDVKAITINLN